jgi:hypothetical protein
MCAFDTWLEYNIERSAILWERLILLERFTECPESLEPRRILFIVYLSRYVLNIHVYQANRSDGTIYKAPKFRQALKIRVYQANRSDGTVYKAPKFKQALKIRVQQQIAQKC